MIKELSLSCLPISRGRIVGFISFPRILALCEIQTRPGFELVSPYPLHQARLHKYKLDAPKTKPLTCFNGNGLVVRVFANGPGDLGSIPGRVIPKTQKMVLDTSLLNTQHYKVRIKGKVEPSREGVAPSPTSWCSSYRKGSLRVTLDYGRQLYFTLLITDTENTITLLGRSYFQEEIICFYEVTIIGYEFLSNPENHVKKIDGLILMVLKSNNQSS